MNMQKYKFNRRDDVVWERFFHSATKFLSDWITTAVIEWRVCDIKGLEELDSDTILSVEMSGHGDEK